MTPVLHQRRSRARSVASSPHDDRRRFRQPAQALHAARRGVALAEGAIVLGVFLLFIFGVCDLGLAVLRQNALVESARRLARAATVHGEKAGPQLAVWGSTAHSGTADGSDGFADVVRPILVTMAPAAVSIDVTWPDGDNRSGDRVQVTLTYHHSPTVPFLLGTGPLTLRGESTMRIEQ